MATERHYVCEKDKDHKTWIDPFFDCLNDHANDKKHPCDLCSTPTPTHIELIFDFHGAPTRCKVLTSFLPDEIIGWDIQEGRREEVYPFLIVLENLETTEQYIWSPYWHIERHQNGTIEKRKYGQFASVVNIDSYFELIEKAKAKGYLKIDAN